MASDLEVVLQEAEDQQLGFCDFIDRLLQREHGTRWERKIERRLKRARLGEVKSLDEFDFKMRPKLSAPAVKELLSCRFIEEGRSIICLGRPGTGKTHVAKALAHAACMKGYSVYTGVTVDILDELEASLADGTFPRVFKRLATADLIVCDELGYLSLDEARCTHLFRLVSARHPKRAMVVTSNTAFKNWGKFFPSEAQAVATVDRLLDDATVLRFTGKSCRDPREVLGAELD
jgi:DNA replication protein DnaC